MLFTNNKKQNNYISDIDILLLKLEKEFTQKSPSRIAEEKKYSRIYFLRDHLDDSSRY